MEIVALPKERWKGTVIPLAVRSDSWYDFEIKSLDQTGCSISLVCGDGMLYCGWTTDLAARIRAHNSGKGAKHTRSRLPAEPVYYET